MIMSEYIRIYDNDTPKMALLLVWRKGNAMYINYLKIYHIPQMWEYIRKLADPSSFRRD